MTSTALLAANLKTPWHALILLNMQNFNTTGELVSHFNSLVFSNFNSPPWCTCKAGKWVRVHVSQFFGPTWVGGVPLLTISPEDKDTPCYYICNMVNARHYFWGKVPTDSKHAYISKTSKYIFLQKGCTVVNENMKLKCYKPDQNIQF